MISYTFVVLAAIFNACMDAFENSPNFNESIFKNWNKKFWCKDVSWQYARKIGGYKLDAWHISKSLMVICIALAISFVSPRMLDHSWWVKLINVGLIWNLTFILFYHKIYRIK